jgi:hypothetical protein
MQTIVINNCFGGFGLSTEALALYNSKVTKQVKYDYDIKRDDPALIAVIEELGKKANGPYASLQIVRDVPDDVKWSIEEYDGSEHVAEYHRTWG